MTLRKIVRQLPTRLAAGSIVLNSGLAKWGADQQTAEHLHGFATGTYPFLAKVDARTFTKLLAGSEIALGAAVLLLPGRIAGTGLAAFSAGLLGLYARTPGMRQEGSVRPTSDGTALVKDTWLLGIALSLLLDRDKRPD